MTAVCKILWMILASDAIIHHLSSQAPFSAHAMRASVHIARDSMKETIDYKIPLRFRDSESTSDQEDLPTQYQLQNQNQHPYRYEKQDLVVPHDGYRLVHVHYHYDGRDNSVGKDATPGCEKTHNKRSKQIRIGGMDDEDDCGTTTPTPSPSSESSPVAALPENPYYSPTNSTLSPTTADQPFDPEKPWNPTDDRTSGTLSAVPSVSPSQPPSVVGTTSDRTQPPTAGSTFIDTFVVELQHPSSVISPAPSSSPTDAPTKHLRTPTTHDVTVLAENSGSSNNNGSFSMGKSYWVVGAAICITAFFGGFATSKICSKRSSNHHTNTNTIDRKHRKRQQDEEAGNHLADPPLGTHSATQNEDDDSSVRFSVAESVDSYHLEDWSVSVVSWSPRDDGPGPTLTNEPSIEVERRIQRLPSGGANDDNDDDNDDDDLVARRDEIEIEFYDIDLEGYPNALEVHHHEVEPPLFDVINLSERKASF